MAAGDGIPSATKIRGPWVSLNANRMKFVGDLFGAGAVDTLFGEENMVGETTAAPMSWDASGVDRRPARCSRRPGRRPSSSQAAARPATPTSPRRVAGAPRPRPRLEPGTRRRGARTGRPTVAPARARLYPPERTVANEQVIRVSGEVCMRLRATWGKNFAVTKRRILCYHTQMRCRAAPDWGSARLGTKTTWRGARLVRVRRRRRGRSGPGRAPCRRPG